MSTRRLPKSRENGPAARQAHIVTDYGTADCLHCGQTFVKHAGIQRYCSPRCREVAALARRKTVEGLTKREYVCKDCGQLDATGMRGVVPLRCSDCTRLHNNKRSRDNRARARARRGVVGKRYGLLTVIEEREPQVYGSRRFRMVLVECSCEARNRSVTRLARLHSGETRSCGCLHRERIGALRRTPEGQAPSYHAMHAMLRTRYGSASEYVCIDCGDSERPHEWSYIRVCPGELTDERKDGRAKPLGYCLHVEHFAPRCKECHLAMDRAPLASVRRLRTILLAKEARWESVTPA